MLTIDNPLTAFPTATVEALRRERIETANALAEIEGIAGPLEREIDRLHATMQANLFPPVGPVIPASNTKLWVETALRLGVRVIAAERVAQELPNQVARFRRRLTELDAQLAVICGSQPELISRPDAFQHRQS